MRDTDLYSKILGIPQPWSVADVELDTAEQQVIVHVRLDGKAPLRCPHCNKQSPRYDRRERTWRHLDTMQFRTILSAEIPRVECPEHGVVQIHVPWAEPGSGFTALFEALVIDWLHVADISAVARMLTMSWDAVDGIQQRAVRRGLERRTLTVSPHIAIDETSFQRRHEYVTVVTDPTTGAVLHVADDRTIESAEEFFEQLSEPQCASLESVSMDMWPAFVNVVAQYVPDASRRICFDKFHVAKYLGDAVDKVRRAEHRGLRADGDNRLTRTRYWWLRNPDKMSVAFWQRFEHLRESSLKTARAWAIKELAMTLWRFSYRATAIKHWKAWLGWALRSRLEPVQRVARMIKKHLWGIINAIVLKQTNATAESINSRIQRIKRRACGFRNRQRFRTAIMFHCGGLDLYPRPDVTS